MLLTSWIILYFCLKSQSQIKQITLKIPTECPKNNLTITTILRTQIWYFWQKKSKLFQRFGAIKNCMCYTDSLAEERAVSSSQLHFYYLILSHNSLAWKTLFVMVELFGTSKEQMITPLIVELLRALSWYRANRFVKWPLAISTPGAVSTMHCCGAVQLTQNLTTSFASTRRLFVAPWLYRVQEPKGLLEEGQRSRLCRDERWKETWRREDGPCSTEAQARQHRGKRGHAG